MVSLESFTDPDPIISIPQLLRGLERRLGEQVATDAAPPHTEDHACDPHTGLGSYLSAWTASSPRPVILLLDEIDAIRDELLFSVLRPNFWDTILISRGQPRFRRRIRPGPA